MIIRKKGSFEAAHMLPDYEGKCSNLHGHSYTYELEIDSDVNPATGMVLDFNVIKKVISTYDHSLLISDYSYRDPAEHALHDWAERYGKAINVIQGGKATAENIARDIGLRFQMMRCAGRISLKETDSSEVLYKWS